MAAVAATAGTALTACAPGQGPGGSQRTIFPTGNGTTSWTADPTGVIVNVGIGNLANTSHARATIRAVKLIAPSAPAIRDLNYWVMQGRRSMIPMGVSGNLRSCPGYETTSAPMGRLSFAARSATQAGVIIVSFIFTRPGHYAIGPVRIDYVSGGHRYWQLYYLSLKITVVPAASRLGRNLRIGMSSCQLSGPGADGRSG